MAGKMENLVGRRFGRLRVVAFDSIRNGKTMWRCECECGKTKAVRADGLKRGVKSCGCGTIVAAHARRQDLSGQVFGRLYVVNHCPDRPLHCKCKCECGTIVRVCSSSLKSKHTTSCGCLQREKAKETATRMGRSNKQHGQTASREYETWHRMRQRCNDSNCPNYKDYGGRGISVCSRWDSFAKFLFDMGPRPSSKHSLDRIDNDGDYCPSNCRWAIQKTQQRNRRSNILITYDGRTKCISEWAEEYLIPTQVLWRRLRKMGWEIHDALTVPLAHTIHQKRLYKRYRRTS